MPKLGGGSLADSLGVAEAVTGVGATGSFTTAGALVEVRPNPDADQEDAAGNAVCELAVVGFIVGGGATGCDARLSVSVGGLFAVVVVLVKFGTNGFALGLSAFADVPAAVSLVVGRVSLPV